MRTLLIRLSPLALTAALAACASAPVAPKSSITPAAAAAAAAQQPRPDVGVMQPIPDPEPEAKPAPRARPAPAARPAPKPAAPHADAARAAQLRAQGLEDLNRGAVDRAIALLQQAKALDPGNALIQRDLERAQRIGRAVKGK